MSSATDLLEMARVREDAYQSAISLMSVDHPGTLLRHLRAYLGEQADLGRLRRSHDFPTLQLQPGGVQELVCEEIEFRSDSRLNFNIKLEQKSAGWVVRQFKFHLDLVNRKISGVRIHLNEGTGRDPLNVPRCHFHIGESKAHVPFPVMNPRLMLHLICENIENDFGL